MVNKHSLHRLCLGNQQLTTIFQEMSELTLEYEFYGPNLGYILELYERYQADPNAVDEATRRLFETWQPTEEAAPLSATHDLSALTGAVNLAQAIRSYGYLSAHLNPLEEGPTLANNSLVTLEFHHLKEDDLRNLPAEIVNLPGEQTSGNAWQGYPDIAQDLLRTDRLRLWTHPHPQGTRLVISGRRDRTFSSAAAKLR